MMCLLFPDVHGAVVEHIWRLHEGREHNVQQFSRVRDVPASRDGDDSLHRREIRQQIRHGRAGLRHFLHHRRLRWPVLQFQRQRKTQVSFKSFVSRNSDAVGLIDIMIGCCCVLNGVI